MRHASCQSSIDKCDVITADLLLKQFLLQFVRVLDVLRPKAPAR